MTHTDAMAVWDTQKALWGCMIPWWFQVWWGDVFAAPQIFSDMIASTLTAFIPPRTDGVVKNTHEVLFWIDPYKVWTGIFRDWQILQAQTFLAFQKVLW